jgi:hypothetical protein
VRKLWKLATLVGAAVAISPLIGALPAQAAAPTGYGFDGTPHTIVDGGSDTTYRAMVGITNLYGIAGLNGCVHQTSNNANLNKCNLGGGAELARGTNWQGDTIAQANPVGSSSGVASLNGFKGANASVTYAGTANPVPAGTCLDTSSNPAPNADMARSSRGPRRPGGSGTPQALCGDELAADTFWGFAQDGIEVTAFNARGAEVQGKIPNPGATITPQELVNIYNCTFNNWSDIPSLGIAPGSPTDGPIEPWGMNSASGTFAAFQNFLINVGGAPAGFDPNAGGCIRKIGGSVLPFENDIKPIVDSVTLSSTPTSVDNPKNWIWWGSFGVFSAFPFTSNYTKGGFGVQAIAAPVNDSLPSPSNIIANTYPIGRTLYHVTRKQEADCPAAPACNFTGNPGPAIPQGVGGCNTAGGCTDFNVAGPSSGEPGAVREFTRFLCRGSASQSGIDPLTGANFFTEITGAINQAGYTIVPSAIREPGSRCDLQSS